MKILAVSISVLCFATAGLFAADNALTPQEKAAGWVLLFDGRTLAGWESSVTPGAAGRKGGGPPPQPGAGRKSGPPPAAGATTGSNPKPCSAQPSQTVPEGASHWEVAAGVLSACGEPAGYLVTKEDYADFILDVDFKTAEDTNSGVYIRSPQGNGGYEVQIWGANAQGYNTGSIVNVAKADPSVKFLADQWNHYEITADGDHMVVALNGVKVVDAHDAAFSHGVIRLQYQKYPIDFKNIKLKPIQH